MQGLQTRKFLTFHKSNGKMGKLEMTSTLDNKDLISLTEDGGVKKLVKNQGTGEKLTLGSIAKVSYSASVANSGVQFAAGNEYRSTVSDSTMVTGWDIGLASMTVGEKSKILCSPKYGYGPEGVPPIIPPQANLEFDIEVIECEGNIFNLETFADNNPLTPRSPEDIMASYLKRKEIRDSAEKKQGVEAIKDFLRGIYVFGLFQGQTGQRAPWYLNPLITFPGMFAIVAAAFFIVVSSGGVSVSRPPASLTEDIDLSFISAVTDGIFWG